MLAAVVKLWAYQPVLAKADRLPESPPWDGERLYNLVGLRGQRDLTTPRIPPATMNALLAWSLRFIEDLAPDITAAIREDQRLADRTRPGQGRIGRYRRESGEVTEDLRRLMRAFRKLHIPLPGKVSAKSGELDYDYGYLTRLIDTEAVCVKKPSSRIVLTESGLPMREGAPLLLVPTGMIDGRRWRNEPIDESEARSLARHLMAACFIVIAYLSGIRRLHQ